MKISEAADASGCYRETIHYYEWAGLPPHSGGSGSSYLVYGPTTIEPLRFITRGRDLRFSLGKVRRLLQLAGDEELLYEG